MHPYSPNSGSDSLQYLQIAENLLKTRDLIGTKSYALKAQESDPDSEAATQILAIVDTLIAGDKKISSNNLDWYAILQLGRRTHDLELIAVQYKRLGVLLNPNRNKFAHAERAYKLVTEAYMVLSNPSRKFQFDNEFGNSNATHFNFIQSGFEKSEMQRNQLIGGSGSGSGGSSGHFAGLEMQQGRNQLIGGSSGQFEGTDMQQGRNQLIGGSSGQFEGTDMQQGRNQLIGGRRGGSSGHFVEMEQGRNQQIGGSSGGSSGHFVEMQQGRNQQIGGSSGGSSGHFVEMEQGRNQQIGVHFDFMQDGSGGELRQSSPIQFVQQQQVFGQQEISFFGEEQGQQDGPILTSQLNRLNKGKQTMVRAQPQQELVRPQPQQPLLRPQPQQTWFQLPEVQTQVLQPFRILQPQVLQPQPQPHQPSHWAQSQSQLNQPQLESREQATRPLHWAQNSPLSQPQPQSWMQQALLRPNMQQSLTEPRPPPESREQPQQPLHSPQQVPWPLLKSPEQPQDPLHSSQSVPQVRPLLQPQPFMQESLPSPQMQTSLPEPQSQPDKTPPESREGVNNGEHFDFGNNADINVEEPADFWTICPYCFYMHEYPGVYADCALRCQVCKKAFHAAKVDDPPAVADGEYAYFNCWGYFPIGISPSYLEKRKEEASNWQPISKMFAVPRGGNTSAFPQGGTEFAFPRGGKTSKPRKPRDPRNSGPRTYIDDFDLEHIFDGISSNDESDDNDWRRYAPKNKKARRYTRKVSPAKKVKQQVLAEMVQDSNTGNLRSGAVAQDGSGVSVLDAAVPVVPGETVSVVPEAAVPSVPVPKAAVDDADKRVGETSRKKVPVPIRKQPGRAAKDMGKLDVVVAQEVSGAGVTDAAEVSFSLTKDYGKPGAVDGVIAEEGSDVSMSDKTGVSVLKRKQPGRVAKDLGNLDGGDVVVAQEGSGVGTPEVAKVSIPTGKQPSSAGKDLEKLDGVDSVVAQRGSVVSMPEVAAASVPARKQPSRVAKDSGKLDGVVAQEGQGVGVPDVAAPIASVAEANKKVMGEDEKKAVGGSGKKRVSVPTRKQPGRVAKDLGKLDLNVEFNNEVEGPARGTTGGSKAVNGGEENVDGVALFDGLDDYLSSLPVLSADAGDKAKSV